MHVYYVDFADSTFFASFGIVCWNLSLFMYKINRTLSIVHYYNITNIIIITDLINMHTTSSDLNSGEKENQRAELAIKG